MFVLRHKQHGHDREFVLVPGVVATLGRAPTCLIQVSDAFVSAEHAEIRHSTLGWILKRTHGSNPVFFDGKPREESLLTSGTSFKIGETIFEFWEVNESASNESPIGAGTRLFDTRSVLASAASSVALRSDPSSAASLRASSIALLEQFSLLLSRCNDSRTLAQETLRLACERLSADRGLIAWHKQDSLEIAETLGFSESASVAGLVTQSVLREILSTGKAVIVGNTQVDAAVNLHGSVQRNAIKAIGCVPLIGSSNTVEGLLYVDSLTRNCEFEQRDAEFLIWIGQIYRLLEQNLSMRRRLEAEVFTLKALAAGTNIVAESTAMLALLERLKKAAGSEAAILILGETGVGKECLAHFVHAQSTRRSGAFVARNCAAIPEDIFESEMFGHVKGAFTGATSDRKGAFREADNGTLFLDEMGDLSYSLQTKLLRAIQERKVHPVGADREIPVNLRIVAATNKDLKAAIRTREFREDLYYRLATVTCLVPALRDRPDDIRPLARHFVHIVSGGTRKLSDEALAALCTYSWPGNVRELRGCIEQAVIFAVGSEIRPDELFLPQVLSRISARDNTDNLKSLADAEKDHILRVLQTVQNNKNEAARVLNIARSTLSLKLKQYGI